MHYEYDLTFVDSPPDARRLMMRLDQDGWEVLSCCGPEIGETLTILARRPQHSETTAVAFLTGAHIENSDDGA